MSKNRYVHLNGDPLHARWWEPPLQTAEGFTAGVITTAFLAAALSGPHKSYALPVAFACAAGYAVSRVLKRWMLNQPLERAFGEAAYAAKCIDKKPDAKTPPTDPSDVIKLKRADNTSMLRTLVPTPAYALYLNGVHALADTLGPHALLALVLPPVVAFLSNAVALGAAFYRTRKVEDGKWVVTNTPAKEEKPEKAPAALPAPNAS